jgi:hypothetical protein
MSSGRQTPITDTSARSHSGRAGVGVGDSGRSGGVVLDASFQCLDEACEQVGEQEETRERCTHSQEGQQMAGRI